MRDIMKHSKLGCCYFPTTVVFIDDHRVFLNSIVNSLKLDFIRVPFVKVSEFNKFLAAHPSQLQAAKWTQSNDNVNYPDHTQHDISINFHTIYQQIYNKTRNNEICLAIIDYAMPACNGIELAQILKKSNPRLKILLLTGEADHQIAVDAFNKGFIDQFIVKEKGEAFLANLDRTIHKLSQDFFCEIFESFGINLTTKNPLLQENAFLELFNDIYKKHNACDYYLIDPTGGYLMLNAKREAQWLIIKNEEDFRVYCELADSEENIDNNNLTLIKEKKCIPFYHGEYMNLPPSEKWNDHLIASEILTIDGVNYPYATFSGFEHSIIDENKVYSFEQYLKDNDK